MKPEERKTLSNKFKEMFRFSLSRTLDRSMDKSRDKSLDTTIKSGKATPTDNTPTDNTKIDVSVFENVEVPAL